MRDTNYYFWSIIFSVCFLLLLVMAVVILDANAHISFSEVTWVEYILLALATWRLNRLFGRDHITSFLREPLYDVKKVGSESSLEKPKSGPRRVLADLFACPWCLSIWSAFVLSFGYLLFVPFFYVVVVLALSAAAAALQVLVEPKTP